MELKEIIEAVKGVDAKEFKEALHAGAHGHYQIMFNDGHKSAKGQMAEKVDALTAQIEEINTQLEAKGQELAGKDEEIAKIAASSPDLEKIKSDYEQKLIAKDQQATEKLTAAEARHKELEQKILSKEKNRVKQQLINELQGMHVDSWAANKAIDDSVMNRIHINEDDSHKIYQADGSTPYMPAEGQTSISLLANEIVATIPAPLVKPPKNNGSNYQGGNGHRPNNSDKKRSEMARSDKLAFIKENGREAFEALPN